MLQRLTQITILLAPKLYITPLFQQNVLHKMKPFFGAATQTQKVSTNENLDENNGKLQLRTRMTETPLSVEKLDTCLQRLASARSKILCHGLTSLCN